MIPEAVVIAAVLTWLGWVAYTRLQLSLAKAPSIQGHARIAHLLARVVPFYDYSDDEFFRSDDAPESVAAARRSGFQRLADGMRAGAPRTSRASRDLEVRLSDAQFTKAYRVPFQYRRHVNEHLTVGSVLTGSAGVRVTDLDGQEAYDLGGSYGVNVLGYDFYKECI